MMGELATLHKYLECSRHTNKVSYIATQLIDMVALFYSIISPLYSILNQHYVSGDLSKQLTTVAINIMYAVTHVLHGKVGYFQHEFIAINQLASKLLASYDATEIANITGSI